MPLWASIPMGIGQNGLICPSLGQFCPAKGPTCLNGSATITRVASPQPGAGEALMSAGCAHLAKSLANSVLLGQGLPPGLSFCSWGSSAPKMAGAGVGHVRWLPPTSFLPKVGQFALEDFLVRRRDDAPRPIAFFVASGRPRRLGFNRRPPYEQKGALSFRWRSW